MDIFEIIVEPAYLFRRMHFWGEHVYCFCFLFSFIIYNL